MVTCAVVNCKNTSAKTSKNKDGITFHRFPRDKERRRLWEQAVDRRDWTSTASSTVCSEHFEARDFYLTESGLRRLAIDSVPSINISPCQQPEPTISQIEPIDLKPTDTEEVIQLKYRVKRLEAIAENRKRRLNLMWQSRRRLKKKMDRMKCMIKHLIKNRKDNGFDTRDETNR
ncbi:THAP domain-containing protein 2-like [Hyposmocoma kahamanoa]|uniref:THAP domain-containing protein 2-like n=1 Tax=Hyposmocoma kahamanoa TaxID=1477025 RepID=UPI000E6D8222|nr:THAP domain-containing protein 2-like [Hyposmocoma kahamanoa]